MQYPPNDQSAARTEAATALLASLRELDSVLIRLQAAAAWVLDAYGDLADAETIRMLRIPGGPARPGRPPVPAADSVTGDETGEVGR